MSSDRAIELLFLDDENESPFVIQEALKGIPLIEPDKDCVFRSNSATISDSNRPLIPIDFGHPFRSNSATL